MVIINRNFEYAGGTIPAGSNIAGVLPDAAVQELIAKGWAYQTNKPKQADIKPSDAPVKAKARSTRRKGSAKQ